MLAAGLMVSASLAAPWMLNLSRTRSPAGPFQARQAVLALPSPAGEPQGAPLSMQIWFPAAGAPQGTSSLEGCAVLRALPLAATDGPRRIVLYLPHFWGRRDDNAVRLRNLASHGYVVLAFDDIALDPIPDGATPTEVQAQKLESLDFTSQEDYVRGVALNNVRLALEARKALDGLDRLTACAAGDPTSAWSNAVEYGRVGFLGYSSGGAAAAEAAAMDPRVAAVVNLDGVLFGQAMAGKVAAPTLYVMSDRPIPDREAMNANDPLERYRARINARDVREQARLAARPGSLGIFIRGGEHTSLSDLVYEPHLSRTWILRNPIAFANAVDQYTRGFFDARLSGRDVPFIDRRVSVSPVVATFAELGLTPGGAAAWPPRQDEFGAPLGDEASEVSGVPAD